MFDIKVPKYERIWIITGSVTLVLFLILFGIMAVGMGLHPPGHMTTINPNEVDSTPPFDTPGVVQLGNNEYEANIIARLFMFQSNEIQLPAGAKVHFKVTTPDVVHGFEIAGTNVNMMVVPGHISEYTATFDKPGDYLIVCNEYCGVGHQLMMGRVIIH